MGTKMTALDSLEGITEFNLVLKKLKEILRERKISYREFAKELGMSESGLKKVFASSDCSFRRLLQMAHALDFQISDLLNEVNEPGMKRAQFSREQQHALLKDMRVFRFFFKLVIERESVLRIQEELNLSERDTFRLLRKLDQLKLIRLLPGGRTKLPKLSMVKDFGPGPLLEAIYREWGHQLVEDLAHPKFQPSGQFIVRGFKLKEETYHELLARLLELEREFLRRSIREMSISTADLLPIRWMWLTDQRSFVSKLD